MLPWAYEYDAPVMPRRHCFAVALSDFWLLKCFCPFFWRDMKFEMILIYGWALHWHFLYALSQLQVSASATGHWQRRLSDEDWKLHRDGINLEGGLKGCSFNNSNNKIACELPNHRFLARVYSTRHTSCGVGFRSNYKVAYFPIIFMPVLVSVL